MFKFRSLLLVVATALTLASLGAAPAIADGRPWLCRDKPVFSDTHPMEYEASAGAGHQWQIFFMQFSPNAAHDGFDILSSRILGSSPASGKLAAGRYFVVIMYRASGEWICPGTARENATLKPDVLSDLCFAENVGQSCQATLTVKPDHTAAGAASP